jgi:hypothetical protein
VKTPGTGFLSKYPKANPLNPRNRYYPHIRVLSRNPQKWFILAIVLCSFPDIVHRKFEA